MTSHLTNPHDKFFKETFSRIEIARDFMARYLPPEVAAALDLETLEARPDSFVDPDLQEQFADLLYRVRLQNGRDAYVYLLLEHKSRPESLVMFQFLRYMVRIWERDRRKGEPLRVIVPLLIHHGPEGWQAAVDFAELFTGEAALRPYWPRFRCELYDLARFSDAEIQGTIRLQIGLLVMKYIFEPALREHLADIFAMFHDLAEGETALEYLRTVLYYIGNAARHLQREEMVTIIEQTLADGGSEVMQTIAEQWIDQGRQQGIQQGIQQGLQQGIQQGLQQGIQRGIQQGVTQGVVQGLQKATLDVLTIRFEVVPPEVEKRLAEITDTTRLRRLLQEAVQAENMDAFMAALPQEE